MKSLAHWAIFSPTLSQIQGALGRWVIAGFRDERGRLYESSPVLVVGLLTPASGFSLMPQVYFADSRASAGVGAGYDWEAFLDQLEYVRYVEEPPEPLGHQ